MFRRLPIVLAVGLITVGLFGDAAPAAARAASPATRALGRTLPEMNFDGVALIDCVDFLRDVSGANIVVNWKALEGAGVTRETLVNIKLRGVSLRKSLSLLLAEAGAGEGVTYTVDQGVVEITTTELANAMTYTRVYDVADLLMEIPDFTDAPDFSLQSSSQQSGGQGGGGGGQGLFGSESNSDEEEDAGPTRTERAEELLSLIRETIYPDIWRDNGGTASIRFFRDSLVVTAPRIVHEAIGGTWD